MTKRAIKEFPKTVSRGDVPLKRGSESWRNSSGMESMSEHACVADLPEEVPTQIGRPGAQALIEDIRESIHIHTLTGNGASYTAKLLRRALDELEMLTPVPVLVVRKTTKYPSHPECMRCARTRHRDLAIKRRKRK